MRYIILYSMGCQPAWVRNEYTEKGQEMMKMAELVETTGIPRTTIHYYLREGLLPEPEKAGKTVAYYGREHVERLLEIQKMQEVDLLPLGEIKKRLAPAREGGSRSSRAASGRAAITRKRILDAAIKEFSEKGYRKTRVTDIISSLGIATMTFYRYFPNKRQLFLEVVDTIVANMVEHVEAEISGERDYVIRMLKRGMAFYRVYSQNQDILQVLRGEAVGEDREMGELVKRIYRRFTSVLVKDFDDWKKEGMFPELDTEITAYALLGASEFAIYRMSMDDRYTIKDFLTQGLDLLMAIQMVPRVDPAPLHRKYEDILEELVNDGSARN